MTDPVPIMIDFDLKKKSAQWWWQELSSRVGDPGTWTITANHNPATLKHCTLPHCTICTHCTLHIAHRTLHTAQSVHTVHCTPQSCHTAHCTHTAHCAANHNQSQHHTIVSSSLLFFSSFLFNLIITVTLTVFSMNIMYCNEVQFCYLVHWLHWAQQDAAARSTQHTHSTAPHWIGSHCCTTPQCTPKYGS